MILHNNLMLALIKLEKYEEAIEEGLRGMNIDQNNIKTIFRLGQAYFYKKNFLRAYAILMSAMKINKND